MDHTAINQLHPDIEHGKDAPLAGLDITSQHCSYCGSTGNTLIFSGLALRICQHCTNHLFMVGPEDSIDTPAPFNFLINTIHEYKRATRLYPKPNPNLAALMEEVGELAQAILKNRWVSIYSEAVQVAALALRIALEGDGALENSRDTWGRMK